MSMDLAKKTFSTQPDYLIAGNAEIVTAVKEASAALKRGAPVVLNSDGKLALLEQMASEEDTAMGVAKGKEDLLALVNEVLADAVASGALQASIDLHFVQGAGD